MIVLSSYLVNKGIDDYNKLKESEKSFIEIEKLMFSMLMNYLHYSFFGVRIMFVPSPAVIFFSEPGTMADLCAKIDSITTMDIFNNLKGKALFKDHFPGTLRFAGLNLMLGCLLAVFAGIGLKRNREYLKFLTGICPQRKLLPFLFISRVILVTGSFLFVLAVQLLVLKIRGVVLSTGDAKGLLVFTAVSIVVLLVFLFSGVLLGGIFSTSKARSAGLIAWGVLVFMIPLIINAVIDNDADKLMANHELNLKKLGVANLFEKNSEKKYGKFNEKELDLFRKSAEFYYRNDYPKILALEKEMMLDLEKLIEKFQKMSVFFPATFYTMTCKEVSSQGYDNYMLYYWYITRMHGEFLRFWIDRVYYHDPKVLVSFIKGTENLYHGQSRVPRYVMISLGLHVFYIMVLCLGSYFSYLRLLVRPVDRKAFKNKKDLIIKLGGKTINVYYTRRPAVRDHLYCVFSGRKGQYDPEIKVILDGQTLTGKEKTRGFIYICDADALPRYLKGLDFVKMILILNKIDSKERQNVIDNMPLLKEKRIGKMERHEKAEILLTILPYIKGSLYLFYHTCKDLPLEYLIRLKNQMQKLVNQGATVVYLSPDSSVNEVKKQAGREILPLPVWTEQVESLEFLEEQELIPKSEDE